MSFFSSLSIMSTPLPLSHCHVLLPCLDFLLTGRFPAMRPLTQQLSFPHRHGRKPKASARPQQCRHSFSFTSARVHRRKQVTTTAGGGLLDVVVLSKDWLPHFPLPAHSRFLYFLRWNASLSWISFYVYNSFLFIVRDGRDSLENFCACSLRNL